MKRCGTWPIGVCSWSLQTDVAGVAQCMRQWGLSHVHLAVGPAAEAGDPAFLSSVEAQHWTVSATMVAFPQEDYSTLEAIRRTGGIAPDECWERNRRIFFDAADVTARLGVKVMSLHLGFLDHRDRAYARKMRERTVCLADAAAHRGITVLLETGQETAEDLKAFLESMGHPALGINFDPANMILYGQGDPVEAVRILGPWVKHVHIKDAVRTDHLGTWGTEVRWAEGQVNGPAFLKALKGIGFEGVLAIEREAGDDRFGDISLAAERLAACAV